MSSRPVQASAEETTGLVPPPLLAIARPYAEKTGGRRRSWIVRRALVAGDLLGLSLAFVLAELLFEGRVAGSASLLTESLMFLAVLPLWLVLASLQGLYDRDDGRAGHSTVDDVVGVFHLVTLGAFVLVVGATILGFGTPNVPRIVTFWALAIAFVSAGRAAARALCRRSNAYVQKTLIVGAGNVGQVVARNLLLHPEYGLELVGFVDDAPLGLRAEVQDVPIVGGRSSLREVVRRHEVERVIVAFSRGSEEELLELVRSLRMLSVQVDIVPRLFDVVGPNVDMHTIQGIPMLGLAPAKRSRTARLAKRIIDLVGASLLLLLTAPLAGYIAWRIRRESPGPILFRQTRLGAGMEGFTALKFRTMRSDTDGAPHREYIRQVMDAGAATEGNGLYKLDRGDAVTSFGRWLRRTSLDELPQLLNVIRGEMSLVGPRPCIPYETEHFAPHHFERFQMPAGLTGLWQVTARARSTFGEALDLDVAYVRSWSVGLDLRILSLTPFVVLRRRSTA